MALYLGSGEKRRVILGGVVYRLNFFSTIPLTNGAILLSSDNYVLKDSSGLYITVKEDN